MKVELKLLKVKDIANNYEDKNENGITGYNGKLDIRPKYQREFVYKTEQRNKVIDTISKGFPLNVMYWVVNGIDSFEILDGQQRTISICEYVAGNFSLNEMYFHNLPKDKQDEILNYELMIYFCQGADSEKLEWFRTINIAGEKLTDQELRNAIYTGEWLINAKKYFSKTNCPAYAEGSNYLSGVAIRQDYLETVLKWISNDNIERYMSANQNSQNANELWLYFKKVIDWVKTIFPNYRKEMKGVDWGLLYNDYQNTNFNSKDLEIKISQLMKDEDVTKKSGIYGYLITNNEKYLNIRSFSDNIKRESFEGQCKNGNQKAECPKCNLDFNFEEMEADHITPWHTGGKSIISNCQMLCKDCNRKKSGK